MICGDFTESTLKPSYCMGLMREGDFRPDSDIDIMILVDLSDEEIKDKGQSFSDLTFDYNYENGLEIMPIAKNVDHLTDGSVPILFTIT